MQTWQFGVQRFLYKQSPAEYPLLLQEASEGSRETSEEQDRLSSPHPIRPTYFSHKCRLSFWGGGARTNKVCPRNHTHRKVLLGENPMRPPKRTGCSQEQRCTYWGAGFPQPGFRLADRRQIPAQKTILAVSRQIRARESQAPGSHRIMI